MSTTTRRPFADTGGRPDSGFAGLTPLERLRLLRARIEGRIVFTTSFGLEDQYLSDLIFSDDLAIDVVTLDTGRLFPETYALWAQTEQKYGRRIRAFYPGTTAVEMLVETQGVDGQYAGVAARKACCDIRKVAPLKRALAGASAWVTGLRGDQSAHRASVALVAVDAAFDIVKANPLIDWTREQVAEAAQTRGVPTNPLHRRGFPSVGCAPCTRAIRPDEDERAGRWWWEQDDKKECGLHVAADGKPVRGAPASEGGRSWAI